MKFLFIHNTFPGQFKHLCKALVHYGHEVVFLSNARRADINSDGVNLIKLPHVKIEDEKIRPSFRRIQKILYTGELFGEAMSKLKGEGFIPDVVFAHPTWGAAIYVKDIFPDSGFITYCEWFFTKGELYNFFPKGKRGPLDFALSRHRNLYILNSLLECDAAISPTYWQYSQFPKELSNKIRIIHDGIDTEFFSPGKEDGKIGDIDLALFPEVVTYATRGMEPDRGFPQFFRSIPLILAQRPNCHIVIMADDKVNYGTKRSDGKTWLEAMKKEVPEANSERVHYIKFSDYNNYRKLLRFSTVHIYLTSPYVLSWSLLEAMSCGCLVVASDTSPIVEVIKQNYNGIIVPFNDSNILSTMIINILSNYNKLYNIKVNARKTIIDKYNLRIILPMQFQLIDKVINDRDIMKELTTRKITDGHMG